MNDVVYLYGFVPPGGPQPPAALAGVADAPVELVDGDGVRAVVSRVPAAAFSADVVEARLEDLAWVGEQGLAHERVVLWFVDSHRILPARLFTMFSGDAALRDALAHRAPGVRALLERIGDRREWNLKVSYDPETLLRHAGEVSEVLRGMDRELAAAPPGRRYLMQRRRDSLARDEVVRAAGAIADELLDSLLPPADDVRRLPLAAADAAAATVVLNAALLVPRDAEPALRDLVAAEAQQLEALGVRVVFTGPWAAYRFAEDAP